MGCKIQRGFRKRLLDHICYYIYCKKDRVFQNMALELFYLLYFIYIFFETFTSFKKLSFYLIDASKQGVEIVKKRELSRHNK